MKTITLKQTEPIDITAPEHVEILIRQDGKVIWINVDGVCEFRACRINKLILNDKRTLVK